MGIIESNFFISLDGVVESPDQWHFPYFNDEMGAAVGRGIEHTTAFLMGRRLYEEWSQYWPTQERVGPNDEVEETSNVFADFINNVTKYVVSNTLTEATWRNTTIVSGDIAEQLVKVKEQTDGVISLSGSATLVRSLLDYGLIDRLHLLVHPIAVGHGRRLFEDTSTHTFELVSHEVFATGVVDVVYRPVAS